MARQHHQLSGHKFEQIPGDSEGQRSLVCYSPWGRKELDTTQQLNITEQQGKKGLPLLTRITGPEHQEEAGLLLHTGDKKGCVWNREASEVLLGISIPNNKGQGETTAYKQQKKNA